jgi:SRSO17 transposase
VGIHGPTKVYLVDAADRATGKPIGVQQLGVELGPKAFREYSWREATNGKMLSGRFCFRRVKVGADNGTALDNREVVWLMMEWPEAAPKPAKFALTTMPRRMPKASIVRIVKERWKTERVYEEMKGELGLDHFEGRSASGWHHHVTVAICCYAFIVAERAWSFPPSTGTDSSHSTHGNAI